MTDGLKCASWIRDRVSKAIERRIGDWRSLPMRASDERRSTEEATRWPAGANSLP